MQSRVRFRVLRWFFEQPRSASADHGQHGGPAKDIDIGEHGGLLLHQAVDEAEGTGARARWAQMMTEILGDHGRLLLQRNAGLRQVGAEIILVEIGAADDGGRGHGNSNGPADIAQHVDEAGRRAHVLVGYGGHHHRRQGNKDAAKRESREHDGNQQRVRADGKIDRAEDKRAAREAEKAGAEQDAVVDARAEVAEDGRASE